MSIELCQNKTFTQKQCTFTLIIKDMEEKSMGFKFNFYFFPLSDVWMQS